VTVPTLPQIRSRLARIGWVLAAAAAVAAAGLAGLRAGASVLAGAALAALNLVWLGRAAERMLLSDPERSRTRALGAYFFRLLLILLTLHATIRLHFLSAPAAVTGFAVFYCSVFVEGVLEAVAMGRR
jgi:hypothetical protein